MKRHRTLTAIALALLLGGLVGSSIDVARFAGQPALTLIDAPTSVAGRTLALVEDGVVVSLQHGEQVLVRDAVTRLPDPSSSRYRERYAQLLYVARLPDVRRAAAVLAARPASTGALQVILLEPQSSPVRPARAVAARATTALTARYNAALGAPRPQPVPLPGPLLLLAGLAVLTAARRPAAAPTVWLACALLGLGSVPGWPLVLGDPVRLVVPLLASCAVVLAFAALAGAPVQRRVASASGVRRLALGSGLALVLVGVFVAVFVNINGFVAPVFRPPDAALSPAEWLVNDLVRPALAMSAAAALPALLCGLIYAWRAPATGAR